MDVGGGSAANRATDRLIWWIITGLAALLVTVGSFVLSQQQAQLTAINTRLDVLTQQDSTARERISTLEANGRNTDFRIASIDNQLSALNAKMDRLLTARIP